MRKLSDAEITAKSVEINKCLINSAPGSIINYDLGVTQTIGDAATLAISLKQRKQDVNKDVLGAICSALKIDFRVAESRILPKFETLGWGKILWNNGRLQSLTEKMPPTQDILGTLGKIWKEDNPTTVEEATLVSLAELSKRPFASDALASDLGVSDADFG